MMKFTFLRTLSAAVVASLLLASPASAHSSLVSVDPAEGSVVTSPPQQVTFVFNEGLRDPAFAGANVNGTTYELDGTVNDTAFVVDTSEIAAKVPGSAPWTVSYQVVSADGHPINGTVNFIVDDGTEPTDNPTDEPKTSTKTDEADSGISAWWWIAGGAVVIVGLLAPLLLRRSSSDAKDSDVDG